MDILELASSRPECLYVYLRLVLLSFLCVLLSTEMIKVFIKAIGFAERYLEEIKTIYKCCRML